MLTFTNPKAASQFHDHKDWQDCQGCPLAQTRKKVVLARGTVPAPLLFVGEAPGPTENVFGEPFVGDAGKVLDRLIFEAERVYRKRVPPKILSRGVPAYAITNIVACFPQKNEQGDFREPSKDEAHACRQRLLEFIGICRPRVIVCLGRIAEKYLPQVQLQDIDLEALKRGRMSVTSEQPSVQTLPHPASLLEGRIPNRDKRELAEKRFVLALVDIFLSLRPQPSHATK